jgi:hypothetical protein
MEEGAVIRPIIRLDCVIFSCPAPGGAGGKGVIVTGELNVAYSDLAGAGAGASRLGR